MRYFITISGFLFSVWILAYTTTSPLIAAYDNFSTHSIVDRYNNSIFIAPNDSGQYFIPYGRYPDQLEKIVIKKEDQYFYYHPGVNPFSILRTITTSIVSREYGGSSTITQQLVKILLKNTDDRTVTNKIKESLLALALEIRLSKQEILTMYLNSVYLGNQAQGFSQASLVYYGQPIDKLSELDLVTLASTLSSPSVLNPWETANIPATQNLADELSIKDTETTPVTLGYNFNSPTAFEISNLLPADCLPVCKTTVDTTLTEQIRELSRNHTLLTSQKGGTEVAVVVIEIPSNEILAVIGSSDPTSAEAGAQINMALEPRPIGSTIKPFIYGAAFERGARPYSLVDDREYKYQIGTGFSLYPKNFDGTYQGIITLQESLANSLNTPSIKLLEFVTLPSFYQLLSEDMKFIPINPLSSYSYGIALGGLEMDLLTLTHYFTTLAQKGVLKPVSITSEINLQTPQNTIDKPEKIFNTETVELINSILTDRKSGAEQFGLKSTLDVFTRKVAVKTGTSRDFHDSWAVGYTPDYVVGVWIGNAKNEPMNNLSGSIGAGTLWRQVMELMETTPYNHHTPFTYNHITAYTIEDSLLHGLPDDVIENHRNILIDDALILLPHDGDTISYTDKTAIKLTSKESVIWRVSGKEVGIGTTVFWTPPQPGTYKITAETDKTETSITIDVTAEATAAPQ